MRLLLLLVLLLGVGAGADEAIHSAEEVHLYQPVAAAYADLSEAWRHLDANGVMKHFASDVKLIDGRGDLLDNAGVRKVVEAAMKDATGCQIDYGVHHWQMEGKVCVVVVHQTRVISYGPKKITRVVEREDRWRKTDQGWQFFDVKFIHQVVTITGDSAGSQRPPKNR